MNALMYYWLMIFVIIKMCMSTLCCTDLLACAIFNWNCTFYFYQNKVYHSGIVKCSIRIGAVHPEITPLEIYKFHCYLYTLWINMRVNPTWYNNSFIYKFFGEECPPNTGEGHTLCDSPPYLLPAPWVLCLNT